MGVTLWVAAAVAAFAIARIVPHRRSRWFAELAAALVFGLALGATATALDFGGWNEPEWRAGVFVLVGSFAGVGLVRLF